MLTDKYLESDEPHQITKELEQIPVKTLADLPFLVMGSRGTHRIYRHPSGYRLSLVDLPMLHSDPFAWEGMVLFPDTHDATAEIDEGPFVFDTDEETNAWIEEMFAIFDKLNGEKS